jgi:AmmeMemoRadiSam system protein B/AmmeMemoRadiSam system protein A
MIYLLIMLFTMFNPQTDIRIRKPAVAGQFYPGNAEELKAQVKHCFRKYAKQQGRKDVVAVIVPHAGYVFSGEVAASAFAQISPDAQYDHIFLLGPSHHVYLDKASVAKGYDYYSTPLGRVKVDTQLCQQIIESAGSSGPFTFEERAHDKEHCLEVQLPFLQMRLKKMPPIVPIIIATQRLSRLEEIAKALRPYLNGNNLFVISSDFSHYPSYEDACKVDKATAEAVLSDKSETFLKTLENNAQLSIDSLATSACGEAAIATLLLMTEKDPSIHVQHLQYMNSGDSPYGEHDRVVGYNSFIFTRSENAFTLSEADRKELKTIARESIRMAFSGAHYHPDSLSQTLKMKCGAFVSLHKNGHLRGCIGHFGEDVPLYQIVDSMARAAAFEDPRFPAVTPDELKDLDIEISVLTPMKRIHDISEFTLGKQGIYMRKGGRSGTFLPQVADEVNWTKEEFLGHCAQDKAGIGWEGWRSADLYTYEAIVF